MKTLWQGLMRRWERADDPTAPALLREPEYQVQVTLNGEQLYVQLLPVPATEGELPRHRPQLGIAVEINQGFPCAHIYTDPQCGDVALSVFGTGEKLLTRQADAFDQVESHGTTIPLVTEDAVARLFDTREFSAFSNMMPSDGGRLERRWGVMEHTAAGPEAFCEPCLTEEAAMEMVRLISEDPDMPWETLLQRFAAAGHAIPEKTAAQQSAAPRQRAS